MDLSIVMARLFPGENVYPAVADGNNQRVRATWRGSRAAPTDQELDAAWQEYLAEKAAEPVPPPTIEERFAALESRIAVLEGG